MKAFWSENDPIIIIVLRLLSQKLLLGDNLNTVFLIKYVNRTLMNKYFDICATTPIDKKVLDFINQYQKEIFGNPSSIND